MNVNIYITTDYEKFIPLAGQKNKPNSNPIKPNFRKAKMNVNSLITKDYRKKDAFVVRKNKPNSNPISVKPKMNANAFSQKDYENKTALRPQKNKPNQSQFQTALFSVKTGNFFPKKLRKRGKSRGISLIWTSSSTFQESCLKFADNSGKSVKFGKSVTFGITGGTYI